MNRHLKAVVCRDYQQFRNWCLDNDRNPRDPSLRLVVEEYHAEGFEFSDAIFLGGSADLMRMVETRIRRKATA